MATGPYRSGPSSRRAAEFVLLRYHLWISATDDNATTAKATRAAPSRRRMALARAVHGRGGIVGHTTDVVGTSPMVARPAEEVLSRAPKPSVAPAVQRGAAGPAFGSLAERSPR